MAVTTNPFYVTRAKQIATLVAHYPVPTIYARRDYADAGCVIAFGANLRSMFRQSASYVDRILKGTKPGELPVGPPTSFELAINAASAKAMKLAIPQVLLNRANAVIE